ncbi:MAG: hypothetical protein E7326_05830 [Clostridiales bacterium]|nr:hypothetical protein [Clostridiales bacterium]
MFGFFKKNKQTLQSDIDNLAEQVALSINKFSKNKDLEYLCYSKYTKMDSVLFACFLVRAMCIGASTNQSRAIDFSNRFMDKFASSAQATHSPNDSSLFQRMFNNRMSFYDRIFMSKSGIENKISAILEEFEYIVKADIVNGGYSEYTETSPLSLLPDGIMGDMKLREEAVSFFQTLPSIISPYFQNVQRSL